MPSTLREAAIIGNIGSPRHPLATRQGRQIRRPVEEETEGVGGQTSRGFRVIEFPPCNLVAWRGIEYFFDFLARNAGQPPVDHFHPLV